MIGYTRAHRDRFNHPLFATQKFCRGYAWDWMVAQAAFKPHDIEIKGQTVTMNRGQFSHSMRYMTKAFGWSLGVTQRFIDRLKTEHMIDTATNHGQIIVTICKYDIYQADVDSTKEENDTPTDTAAIQDRYSSDTNKKEGNKGKKVKVSTPAKFKIPKDWVPSTEDYNYAITEGIHESMVNTLSEEFQIYWFDRTDKDSKKSNKGWRMTWQGNVRRQAQKLEYSKQMNGGHNGNGTDHLTSNRQAENTERLRRIITAAAEGTSTQDWATD